MRNKINLNKWRTEHRKLFPWIYIFDWMKYRCTNPNCKDYKYNGGKGIKCLITKEEIKELWFRDKAYLMERPSIDRIDSTGNYEIGNCRFIEHIKNIIKSNKESNIKAILQYDLQGNFIKEWQSSILASRILKISSQNLVSALKKKSKTAGGYIWNYK